VGVAFDAWLADLEYSPVKNMAEMVELSSSRYVTWKGLPSPCLKKLLLTRSEHPDQDYLEWLISEAKPDPGIETKRDFVCSKAREIIDKALEENSFDAILAMVIVN
jgi:hypothetical protein